MAVILLSSSSHVVQGQESGNLTETEAQELQQFRAQESFQENLERALANSVSLRDRIDAQIETALAAQRPAITAVFVVLALLPLLGAIAVWLILNRLEDRANAYAQEMNSIKNDAMAELLGMMNEAQSVLHQIQTTIHEPLPKVPIGSQRELTKGSQSRDDSLDDDLREETFPSPPAPLDVTQNGDLSAEVEETSIAPEELNEEIPPSFNSILDSQEEEAEETPAPSFNSILDSQEENEEVNPSQPQSVNSILDDDPDPDAEPDESSDNGAKNGATVPPPVTYRGGDESIATAPENRLNGNSSGHHTEAQAPVQLQSSQVSAAEFCRQANALFFSGRYPEAIAAYQQAVQLKPDYHQAWSNQGSALFHLQRYPEAISAYNRALGIHPDYPEAWNNKGGALSKLGQYEEALAAYERAVELKPDYVEAWNNRGLALMELKRYKESVASYNRAVKLKPDYVEAWNNRGLAFAAADLHDHALRCFEKAQSLNPDYLDSYRNQGVSLAALERYPEAIAAYRRGTEIQPQDIPTWYYLGQLLTQLQRYDEAIAAYDEAIALQPAIPEIWYNRAGCYSVQGFVAPCLESLQEAIRLAPHPYRERAQVDPRFDEIRQDERFKRLLV